jgi:hypothetical protein
MIADEQGGQHRARWNFECLDHESPYDQREKNGDDDCLEIFAKNAFASPFSEQNHTSSGKNHQITTHNASPKLLELGLKYKLLQQKRQKCKALCAARGFPPAPLHKEHTHVPLSICCVIRPVRVVRDGF